MAKRREQSPRSGSAEHGTGAGEGPGNQAARGNHFATERLRDGGGSSLKDRVLGGPSPLPFREELEALFGIDLSDVQVYLGQDAEMDRRGASAAASGTVLVFADTNPDKAQVIREVTHLVQEHEFGPGTPGTQSSVNDAAEHESRQAGDAAGGGGIEVQQAPSAEVQLDPADTWQEARRRAYEIKDALLDHWTEDEKKALRQIRGQSTLMLQEIRAQYSQITGHNLESDFREYCNSSQYREALSILWRQLSIYDRLRSNVDPGWLWDSGDEEGMLDVLRSASSSQLAAAANSSRVRRLLQEYLNDTEYYQARKIMQPDNLYPVVLERIQNANNWFNDDEQAVYSVLLDLNVGDRRRIWNENPGLFDFMNHSERSSVRRMCLGSEADALEERMKLATEGWGTEDEEVAETIEHAQRSANEERTIQALLRTNVGPNGQPLSEEDRAALEQRLSELGGIQSNLLTVERDEDGDVSGGFLGDLHGDVSGDEFQAFSSQIGVSQFELAKQQILDAIGFWNDDEASINDAFDRLSAGDQTLRDQLWNDAEVQQALTHLNTSEQSEAETFAQGTQYDINLQRLSDAYYGMDTDEEGLFRIVGNMSSDDRGRMTRERPAIWRTLMGSGWLTSEERDMLRTCAETGRIPTDRALDWAFGGSWDGTEDEMIAQTFALLSPEERATYRMGYWLQSEGVSPADPEQQRCLREFQALFARMDSELGDDDLQQAMDQLIGLPSREELKTEEGRLMAAGILHHRMQDKMALGSGLLTFTLADGLTDADETRDQASVQLDAAYNQAMEDGAITADELAVLAALDANFAKRYREHVQTVDMIRNIAGMVAAIAVGILVTVLTGGGAGPAVGSLLSQWGAAALAGGVAGAAAKVATSELMAGDHYDAISSEGAVDAATGFADGATAVLSAGLAARFSNFVGLSRTGLAGQMAAGALETTGAAARYAGRNFAGGALRGTIEGFLSGVVGEIVMTAADAQIWRQSVWDVVCSFGVAVLRGGGIGAATGGIVGGPAEALSAFVEARRIPGLMDDLARHGLVRADLEEMSMDVVQAIGSADAALGANRMDDAARIFDDLGAKVGADDLARIRAALTDAHGFIPQSMDDYTRRVAQLASQGDFDQTMYHGSNSDMLDGLDETQGRILSAEDLHQSNVTQATGEGDAFSGRAGRKDFVSVGSGESGFGTALAYADAGGSSTHYNVKLYTFDELDDEIRRLQNIVDNWGSIPNNEMGGPMGQMFGRDIDQFQSQLGKLRSEMDIRLALPEGSPRRLGGPGQLDNYPVLFEFDGQGLNHRGRPGVSSDGMLGGEGSVYDPIDLRQRLVRAYAPMENMQDLHARLKEILGHDNFELIPLEATSGSTPTLSQSTRSATRDGLTELERSFQASERAYESAALEGRDVSAMDALEHMNE